MVVHSFHTNRKNRIKTDIQNQFMYSKNISISFTVNLHLQQHKTNYILLDKHLCASTVDVGSDGGMLDVTMLLDVDEGTSLDAEEEGPRSVSGSVGVVAKLLQSLPTAGV
jgi:hypothetical protein